MELLVGSFAYAEDTYRRERLTKDYARGSRRRERPGGLLARAVRRVHGDVESIT